MFIPKRALTALLFAMLGLGLTGCPSSPAPKPDEADKTDTGAQTTPLKTEPRQRSEAHLGAEAGVTAFKVGDLVVLHKPTPANQVVSAQLYFVGGAMRLTPATQGLEKLTLSVAASGGTRSTPKDEFNGRLDAVGASVGSFSDRDYSGMAMKTIVPYFDEVFSLFAQAATQPALPEGELDLEKKRQTAQYEAIFENNDSLVGYMASQLIFKGHPYANTQLGTNETIPGFTTKQLAEHHKMLLDPTNMLLVVVGDIPQEQLKAKVQEHFGALKGSGKFVAAPAATAMKQPMILSEKKEIPTHYILGLFSAPAPDHPDYAAMDVAMDYLSDRLFEEVRTKRNLTYAVSSGVSSQSSNYGYFYVTAVKPEETMPVIYAEVDKLQKDLMSDQQLKETLNVFVTGYYMGQETNASQASALAEAQLIDGDWRMAATRLERLRAVKPEDVKRVINTYVKNLQYGVVGPTKFEADAAIFKR